MVAGAPEDARVALGDERFGLQAARLDPGEYGRVFLLGIALARTQKVAAARTALTFFVENAPASAYARELAAARGWLAGQVR